MRPREGFRPTPPQKLAGMRIEPAMSVPCAIGTMPETTAATAPPLEPPALKPLRQGVLVLPYSAPSVVPAIEYSGAALRPMMLTPAAFTSVQYALSCAATMPLHNRLPNSMRRPPSWP